MTKRYALKGKIRWRRTAEAGFDGRSLLPVLRLLG